MKRLVLENYDGLAGQFAWEGIAMSPVVGGWCRLVRVAYERLQNMAV